MSPTLRFVPAMYAAALSGRKTQTRRVITPQPTEGCGLLPGPCELYHPAIECKGMFEPGPEVYGIATEDEGWVATYGPPGTTLPIVTTWAIAREWNSLQPCIMDPEVITSAHPIWFNDGTAKPTWAGKSRPARFLPKSLYHLAPQVQIVSTRAEPLHAITEEDAIREGTGPFGQHTHAYRDGYERLWDSLFADRNDGLYAWKNNPGVWRIEFKLL